MNVFFVQPSLTKYRLPIVRALSERHNVTVFASTQHASRVGLDPMVPGWVDHVETSTIACLAGRLRFQRGVLSAVVKRRPDAIIIFGDFHYISYWLALLVSRLLSTRVYSHGQGLYAEPCPGRVKTTLFRCACWLSTKYICYTDAGRASLLRAGCCESDVVVAANSLTLDHVVRPQEKTYSEKGILFLGRLRSRSGLEKLVEAVEILRVQHKDVELHVVGDGELAPRLREMCAGRDWLRWHGPIHDDARIAEISRSCRIACYPGDAGLSVVHFFGLSLPPVIHDAVFEHGPEASYVVEGLNGILYSRPGGAVALARTLTRLWASKSDQTRRLGENAFATYTELNAPPLGRRLLRIIE